MRRRKDPLPHISNLSFVEAQDREVVDIHRDRAVVERGRGSIVLQDRNLRRRSPGEVAEERLAKPEGMRPAHGHHLKLWIDDLVMDWIPVDVRHAKPMGGKTWQAKVSA